MALWWRGEIVAQSVAPTSMDQPLTTLESQSADQDRMKCSYPVPRSDQRLLFGSQFVQQVVGHLYTS